ncbi:hypothetical protein LSCM1_06442 [Leishmania martiniquensis]|uniref:Uncharacterized protein n=1 Tax=Leishmania martiniquensis TaxID=1580590 RepID=A0A836KMN9_9TRYP|nr:hypothetical protein LSCM1_06442 [Leishmania martiniquensis]
MELHPLSTAPVRILFCGRPALTTGVVNLRLLLGGDGKYCLAEKRKAKLQHNRRDCAQGDVADRNSFQVSVHATEKRESVYRVCSSHELPDGCYHVKADRHYWVMRTKGEADAATARALSQSSASASDTQATLVSSSLPLIAAASAAQPLRTAEDSMATRTQDAGSAPAAAGAMLAAAESPSALTSVGDAECARVESKQQKTLSPRRKHTRRAKAVEEGFSNLPLISTTPPTATSLVQASSQEEQQQGGPPGHAAGVVGNVEEALGRHYLGTPPSARSSTPVAVDALGKCEEAPSSQHQREQSLERRKKASRVYVDAIAEEGGGSAADPGVSRTGTKATHDNTGAGGRNGAGSEVSGSAPLAEQRAELDAGSPQPMKKPQRRGKRRRSSDLATGEPPESLPLPTLEATGEMKSRKELKPGELEVPMPASTSKPTGATSPLLSMVAASDGESALALASRARKSGKSGKPSAANSAASAAAALDAADTATLSKAQAAPLSPLPHCPVSTGHTASLAPPPPQQQQQEATKSPAARSQASVPQDATPNVLYSNRSSSGHTDAHRSTTGSAVAPAAHGKLRQRQQEQHDGRFAFGSPATRSQVDANRSASTSSLLGPLPPPLLQHQSQWGEIGGGAAGLVFHDGAMSGVSGGRNLFPSDSPALGFTQVHNTLTEEFSLDMSESESSSAASEYLYDVVE